MVARWVPRIALVAALTVFTVTLFLAVISETSSARWFNLLFILLLAVSTGLAFVAQKPNVERAALFFWFGAGVWGAAAFHNFQLLGLWQLLVAALCAASGLLIEREQRAYSLWGPALFIGTGVGLALLASMWL